MNHNNSNNRKNKNNNAVDRFSRSHRKQTGNVSLSRTQNFDVKERTSNGDVSLARRAAAKKQPVKKKRKAGAIIGRIALTTFLVGIITVCLFVGAFVVYVFGFVDSEFTINLDTLRLDGTTVLYKINEKGERVELTSLHGEQNRIWVGLDTIPELMQNSVIAIEDKRFRTNYTGVDWKRTFGSFVNIFYPVYDEESGGSTITQQLIKVLTGDDEKSPIRKIREIMRARQVTQSTSLETVLECYLNTVYFGNGCHGIQTASEFYFGKKDLSTLTAAECATLTAIIKSPTYYDPIKYFENNTERRNLCLSMMYEQNYISENEYNAAKEEKIKFTATTDSSQKVVKQINSYFVDQVIEDVIRDLMDTFGYNKTYATNYFYSGGFSITTTLDEKLQAELDNQFAKSTNFPFKDVQASICVMDYQGHVKGLVGGRGEKTVNRAFNRATMAERQPGSTMKPVAVYGPALQKNDIWYSKIEQNQALSDVIIDGKKQRWPKNYDGTYSGGSMSVQRAIEISLNTIPVRICNRITPRESYRFMTERLGFTTLVDNYKDKDGIIRSDVNLSSMALGGCEYGVTVREMAAAYATFGNLGKYWKPTTYTEVVNQKNEIVLKQQEKPFGAFSEDTADIMNKLLQNVVKSSGGTGRQAAFGGWPMFGKTGTTSDNKDRWYVGGTPNYVAAVWIGYDQPKTLNLSYNPALRLWKACLEPLHKNLKMSDFPTASTSEYRRYCLSSGMAATTNCGSTGMGWFKASYAPACTTHGGRILDAATKPIPAGTTSKASTTSSSSSKAPSASTSSASSSSTAPKTQTSSVAVVTSQPPIESKIQESSSPSVTPDPEPTETDPPEDTEP